MELLAVGPTSAVCGKPRLEPSASMGAGTEEVTWERISDNAVRVKGFWSIQQEDYWYGQPTNYTQGNPIKF